MSTLAHDIPSNVPAWEVEDTTYTTRRDAARAAIARLVVVGDNDPFSKWEIADFMITNGSDFCSRVKKIIDWSAEPTFKYESPRS